MPDSRDLPSAECHGFDPDALALASMIADHLRGIPIRADELPPSAHRLVAAYVAKHDYGRAAAGAETTFGGVRLRFRARTHTGDPVPEVPDIDRPGRARVIDAEPAGQPRRALPGAGEDTAVRRRV